MATLLLADNNTQFRQSRTKHLEKAGHKVLTAKNSSEAERILVNEHVDLAILDIRLDEERNQKDYSGLRLARTFAPFVPKIIMTAFYDETAPEVADLSVKRELPMVAHFINKKDGAETLLFAVRETLDQNIFIVHGRDEDAKEQVKRYISSLGLRPIILHELPDGGRAIVQKFEDYSAVGFAIVLLTPDDVGGLSKNKNDPTLLEPRARQNVIFELGYFISRLGRKRVKALVKGGVRIPSDYLGVVFTEMDPGNDWKDTLKREIENVGIIPKKDN